jgi:hypothetical protein
VILDRIWEVDSAQRFKYLDTLQTMFRAMRKSYENYQDPIIFSTLVSSRKGEELSLGLAYTGWISFLWALLGVHEPNCFRSFLAIQIILRFYIFKYLVDCFRESSRWGESLIDSMSDVLSDVYHQIGLVSETRKLGCTFMCDFVSDMILCVGVEVS